VLDSRLCWRCWLCSQVHRRLETTWCYFWFGNAEFAGVDKAGVDNSAPYCRDGLCRSGQISMMWQGWTLQEWTMRHHVAGMDNAGVDNAGVVKCLCAIRGVLWTTRASKTASIAMTATRIHRCSSWTPWVTGSQHGRPHRSVEWPSSRRLRRRRRRRRRGWGTNDRSQSHTATGCCSYVWNSRNKGIRQLLRSVSDQP